MPYDHYNQQYNPSPNPELEQLAQYQQRPRVINDQGEYTDNDSYRPGGPIEDYGAIQDWSDPRSQDYSLERDLQFQMEKNPQLAQLLQALVVPGVLKGMGGGRAAGRTLARGPIKSGMREAGEFQGSNTMGRINDYHYSTGQGTAPGWKLNDPSTWVKREMRPMLPETTPIQKAPWAGQPNPRGSKGGYAADRYSPSGFDRLPYGQGPSGSPLDQRITNRPAGQFKEAANYRVSGPSVSGRNEDYLGGFEPEYQNSAPQQSLFDLLDMAAEAYRKNRNPGNVF
jgi:hypothetical protein